MLGTPWRKEKIQNLKANTENLLEGPVCVWSRSTQLAERLRPPFEMVAVSRKFYQ
jgi:hypothetical protein